MKQHTTVLVLLDEETNNSKGFKTVRSSVNHSCAKNKMNVDLNLTFFLFSFS